MVDTASVEHKEVLDLWRSYLASRPQDFTNKPQWSRAEQGQWKIFDLGGGFVYPGDKEVAETRATVCQIAPARPGDSTEYVVRTIFTRPDNFQTERRTYLHRVYAMRENGRWVLSNPLSRTTANWIRTTFERITYVHPPEHTIDAGVANYQVFSGVPKLGEFYAHELTHMVLGWVLPSLGAPQVLDE